MKTCTFLFSTFPFVIFALIAHREIRPLTYD